MMLFPLLSLQHYQASLAEPWYPYILLGRETHCESRVQKHNTVTQPGVQPASLNPESNMPTVKPANLLVRGYTWTFWSRVQCEYHFLTLCLLTHTIITCFVMVLRSKASTYCTRPGKGLSNLKSGWVLSGCDSTTA